MTGSSTGVTFRSAAAGDVSAIGELWERSGLGSGSEVDRAEIVERMKEDDGFFVVGTVDATGPIVAVAMGCYDNHRGWLKRVAVDPDHRGCGLGRLLVAEVEKRFVDAGVTKLRLAVWDDNADGAEFWQQLDYVELPDIRYFAKEL